MPPHLARDDLASDSSMHRRNHSPPHHSLKSHNDSLKRTNDSRRRHHQSPNTNNEKARSRSPRRVTSRLHDSPDSSPSSPVALGKEKKKSNKSNTSKRINSEIVLNNNNKSN